MILRFLKRAPKVTAPASPVVPDGVTVWAIGDVHGCLELLKHLVDAIIADARSTPERDATVIFLGDYIDRGPDSRGVIGFLTDLARRETSIDWRFLMGNHEDTMLKFLVDPKVGQQWCEYGGDATLASFGLKLPQMRHRVEAWAHVATDLQHRLRREELDFLRGLEMSISIGDYFFAHAGARPGEPLEKQSREDLIWIRRSFLDSTVGFERIVVHGHTPESYVHSDARRVGLDTKAYASGVLTALRLSGAVQETLQAVRVSDHLQADRPTTEPSAPEVVLRRRRLTPAPLALSRKSDVSVSA